MFEKLLEELKEYANNKSYIESVLIVGSYARQTNKEDSDLDIMIITSEKSMMIKNQDFIQKFGDVLSSQIEYYGACTSIRVWYEDKKEVEFGIVEPSWIEDPLDQGTHRVLSDGYKVLIDKKDYFKNIKL